MSCSQAGEDRQEKVLGFDTFIWKEWMPAQLPYCIYQTGESFLPEARRLIHQHGGGKIELIQADLNVYVWGGGPDQASARRCNEERKLGGSDCQNLLSLSRAG